MTDSRTPWAGDAVSLVDAYRSGDHSPLDELDATLDSIEASDLNAFSFLDVDTAHGAATEADISKPFGGVPLGVKELEPVEGWPDTEGSFVLRDRVATYTRTHIARLRDTGGATLVGLTTSSEFGGVNLTRTVLNGATLNPWNTDRTPGGSSGGSASAVAGGLLTLATGSDGGGSIRIPAGFCGLLGLKTTYGRIPKGPNYDVGPLTTSTVGGMVRSVHDSARWLDVCNGSDLHDPSSLPRIDGWEAGLGTHLDELRGLRVAVIDDFGGAVVSPYTAAWVRDAADTIIADLGLVRVDVDATLPNVGTVWSLANMAGTFALLGDAWPDCKDDLTPEMRFACEWAAGAGYGMEARIKLEHRRTLLFEAMANIFEQADLVITSSNPDIAFDSDGPLPSTFGGIRDTPANNGKLTIPANLYGSPAISIPVAQVDGLPVGMQIMAPHHRDAWLLDAALVVERERPWPLTVNG